MKDVNEELNELFLYIDQFKPLDINLDTELKPFIPDYIPAVGDIDAFIKVKNIWTRINFYYPWKYYLLIINVFNIIIIY